ncbi:LLM class flavin-dependent oxidoreductase [Streptomyces sp. MN13]
MPVTVVRFNLVEPRATPASLGARYRAALEMAAYADTHGVTTVQTEEHHGVADNWLPSPFVFAGAVLGATRRIAVTVAAAIGPLYDPLRLAEDIAVLDLLSGGRLVTVAGIGYRAAEYERAGVPWARRGRLQDELLETLLRAWTGEEFAYRGRTVRVTPRPFTEPHPLLLVGGSSRAAARRAARLGLPFFAEGVYRVLTPDECVARGADQLVLHPLVGGMPVDEGWRSLRLLCEDVLPRLGV